MKQEPAALSARELIALDRIDDLRFRARHNQTNHMGALFGGQALAQALAAAQQTAPVRGSWSAHNCIGQFLRGGALDVPVDYAVEIMRDGRRFASRRVVASQAGKPIFDMLASFHDPETGVAHQVGDVEAMPAPENLQSLAAFARAHAEKLPAAAAHYYDLPFPVELRLVNPERVFSGAAATNSRDYWFRMASASAIGEANAQQCLLAFMSDYWLAGAVGAPHRGDAARSKLFIGSLNHSLWFHAPARVDEWLLYRTESPWAGDGRGLARGLIYDRAGKLVASSAQEICMRTE